MKDSIRAKLDKLAARHAEVSALLADPDVIGNQDRFRQLSQEYSQLEPIASGFARYQRLLADKAAVEELQRDPELRAMAEEDLAAAEAARAQLERELMTLLLPTDPLDNANIYLEVRAGTGGDEAALFAGDLFRMYARHAETRGWQLEILSASEGEHGGYKEIISRIQGKQVYSRLKFESGTHRVQRVPVTEAQGRIHTSACTVAILPEVEKIADIDINPAELRIDTYRASGAGGQHVNKTDSAIRITHLPSGIVVECQSERSQHKNRARAMSLLQARLLEAEVSRRKNAETEARRLQVGSGDRSERIRTYNFPQGRVTDHRINLTLYKLEQILDGQLDELLDALQNEFQADQLAALGKS